MGQSWHPASPSNPLASGPYGTVVIGAHTTMAGFSHGAWDLNLGPLEDRYTFLTTFSPKKKNFLKTKKRERGKGGKGKRRRRRKRKKSSIK